MSRPVSAPALGGAIEQGPHSAFLNTFRTALNNSLSEIVLRLNQVNPQDGSEFQRQLTLEPLTVAAITGDTDDWNPQTAGDDFSLLRVPVTGGDFEIRGMVHNPDDTHVQQGQVRYLVNIETLNRFTIVEEALTSVAENRFSIGGNQTVTFGHAFAVWYDFTSLRWRALTR